MKDITFIIPNRGGDKIDIVKNNFYNTFKSQFDRIQFIVINQCDNYTFKRGQLYNIAVNFVDTEYVGLIDNDIYNIDSFDIINTYEKLGPFVAFDRIAQVTLDGDSFKITNTEKRPLGFGAFNVFKMEDFRKSGGFSNLCFGWGCEDNIFNERIKFNRYIHVLGHITHPRRINQNKKSTDFNGTILKLVKSKKISPKLDGFVQTRYTLVDRKEYDNTLELYVSNISVTDDYSYKNLYNKANGIACEDNLVFNYKKHFDNHTKTYCVIGVLETEAGINIKNEMIRVLSRKYDVITVSQSVEHNLFEYQGIYYANKLVRETQEPCLYVHTKGAFNGGESKILVRRMWYDEFVIHKSKYEKLISENIEKPIVITPFCGSEKHTWFNGFYLLPNAANKIQRIKLSSDRFYYESFLRDYKDIKIIGTIMNNVTTKQNRPKMTSYIDNYKTKKIEKLNFDEKIIVSMTTWKGRINNIPSVLNSIFSQTLKPNKIVINLSSEEFKNKEADIPAEVIEYINSHDIIEINWIDGPNTKQWKKFIPTMKKYPNDVIICIDDDKIYLPKLIETLYTKHLEFPNNPIQGGSCVYAGLKCHSGPCSLVLSKFFWNIDKFLNDDLYKMHSSDIFFTYLAKYNGFTYVNCGFNFELKSQKFNEVAPMHLEKSEKDKLGVMWRYMTKHFPMNKKAMVQRNNTRLPSEIKHTPTKSVNSGNAQQISVPRKPKTQVFRSTGTCRLYGRF